MSDIKIPIIYHDRCLSYHIPGHPESPVRIANAKDHLMKKGYQFHTPTPVEIDDIICVHTQNHIERLEKGDYYDPDTPAIPGIFEIARISCGGAILAQELSGFSLCRPPGHHATRNRIMGFCYLNNIAIAVVKQIRKGERISILDIDAHHGNGTEEIFAYNKDVLYCSLHQSPLYPGTGLTSYENIINLPLRPGTGGEEYLDGLDYLLGKIVDFRPDRIGVSAGFDTYRGDPLTNLNLKVEDYYQIGMKLNRLNVPVFSVLEGGYSSDLPLLMESYLSGLCGA
jgi:acetoin utilization deacetylase AcuC-like enzyme